MTDSPMQVAPDRHSFIVRVWREGREDQSGGQWRGSVQHVASGQHVHFSSFEALNRFLQLYVEQPAINAES